MLPRTSARGRGLQAGRSISQPMAGLVAAIAAAAVVVVAAAVVRAET